MESHDGDELLPEKQYGSDAQSIGRESVPEEQSALTNEDREHIALDLEILNGFSDSGEREKVDARCRLRAEGDRASAYIFERLRENDPLSDIRTYFLLQGLSYSATSRDAERVAQLLFREDVGSSQDRSNRCVVLSILERVGTSVSAEHIVRFVETVLRSGRPNVSEYGGRELMNFDRFAALGALMGIRKYTVGTEKHEVLDRALAMLDSLSMEHGFEKFTEEERVRALESTYARDDIFMRKFQHQERGATQNEDELEGLDDDRALLLSFEERRRFEAEARLDVVRNLRHEAKRCEAMTQDEEMEESPPKRWHWLEHYEEHPSPYTPTLGIEIEIREQAVLTDAEKWGLAEGEQQTLRRKKKEKYNLTEALGVPAGKDAFWEFAHQPARYHETLGREVQALIQMGLINAEYKKHSLHLTVGGVTSEGETGSEALLFARALEATAWSTSGGRLMRPILTDRFSWSTKGVAGVKERIPEQIKLGQNEAIEIRTFQLQSLSGLNRLLKSAFFLGTALRAYQKETRGMRNGDFETTDDVEKQLFEVWKTFSAGCNELFTQYNLTSPNYEEWSIDHFLAKGGKGFPEFAELLNEAVKDPKSRGGKFVHDMRALIIRTRGTIARILSVGEQSRAEKKAA